MKYNNIALASFLKFEERLVQIGDEIAAWRKSDSAREIHDQQAFKTEADLAAHKRIISALDDCFGSITVLSEECFALEGTRPSHYWLIDPIDGTASWYDGFPGFVTQAAYMQHGRPVYGVVYAPALGKLWSAHQGHGAFLNRRQLPKLTAKDQMTLVDNYPEPRHIAKYIFNALQLQNYMECGSMGLKSCLVADGTANIFIKDIVFRDWDIAAADVILTEVGAIVSDLLGNPIVYNEEHEKNDGLIIASHQQIQNQIVSILTTSLYRAS